MSDFNVTVDTWEFRAALASVIPHLDSSADPDPLLCRIRAYVTPDGVVLVATDRFTLKLDGFAAADNYPDVANIIERAAFAARLDVAATGGLAKVLIGSGRYVVNPLHLARFVAAGKAYAVELAIEPAGNPPALLVRCSTDFAGLMLPRRLTEAQADMWQASLRNLPELTQQVSKVHPIAPEVRSARERSEVQDLSDLIPTQDDDEDGSDG